MRTYKQWQRRTIGTCPLCGGKPGSRGLQWKFIGGRQRGVMCQDLIHGGRTIQPGQQCFDHQGNVVQMPD
jgi:hypothetical protein